MWHDSGQADLAQYFGDGPDDADDLEELTKHSESLRRAFVSRPSTRRREGVPKAARLREVRQIRRCQRSALNASTCSLRSGTKHWPLSEAIAADPKSARAQLWRDKFTRTAISLRTRSAYEQARKLDRSRLPPALALARDLQAGAMDKPSRKLNRRWRFSPRMRTCTIVGGFTWAATSKRPKSRSHARKCPNARRHYLGASPS